MTATLETAPAVDPRNPHGVEVGQIWISCDKRDDGRRIKVMAVDLEGGKAQVQSPWGLGMRTRISLKRFRPNSTGYRLEGEDQ